jgi:hypothetical protein
MREVAIERAAVLVAQLSDAARKRHAGEIAPAAREIGMRKKIAADGNAAILGVGL